MLFIVNKFYGNYPISNAWLELTVSQTIYRGILEAGSLETGK